MIRVKYFLYAAIVLGFILSLDLVTLNKYRRNYKNVQTKYRCASECTTGVPCQYPDELDFRIIVLTYNRPDSLSKCLSHIAKLDTLGDKVGVDIWIDR